VQVIQGGNVYGTDVLKKIKIAPALFEGNGPSIGNTNSTQCNLTLRLDSGVWPRAAEFKVRVRLVSDDGLQQSEWLDMGTFYTDERSKTKGGDLNIIAFDAMLKTETSWTDKVTLPDNWPITARAAANLISTATGIEIESISELDNTVAFVGLDTASTAREGLGTIAAGLGGNWNISAENKLRLVRMQNYSPAARPNLLDGANDFTGWQLALSDQYSGLTITVDPDEHSVEWVNNTGLVQIGRASTPFLSLLPNTEYTLSFLVRCVRPSRYYPGVIYVSYKDKNGVMHSLAQEDIPSAGVTSEWGHFSFTFTSGTEDESKSVIITIVPPDSSPQPTYMGLKNVKLELGDTATAWNNGDVPDPYADIGMNMMDFSDSPALSPVSGVELETYEGDSAAAGNSTGTVIKAACNFSNSGVAALALANLTGYVYKPFNATGALLDPAAEIGDYVYIDGEYYQICRIEWNINTSVTAGIAAEYEAEIEHEYVVSMTPAQALKKALNSTDEKLESYSTTVQMNSAIQQSASNITSTVGKTIKEVAGGNLLVGTGDFSGWRFWTSTAATHSVDAANHQVDITVPAASSSGVFYADALELEPGQTYTFSCYAKKAGSVGSFGVGIYNASAISDAYNLYFGSSDFDTEWGKISGQFTAAAVVNGPYRVHLNLYTDSNFDTPATLSLKEIKIEKGTLATDWTPSWEDKTTSTEIISTINQSAEQITIDASKVNLNGYVTVTNLSTSGNTVINGDNIKTGRIQSVDGDTYFDLSAGVIRAYSEDAKTLVVVGNIYNAAANSYQVLSMYYVDPGGSEIYKGGVSFAGSPNDALPTLNFAHTNFGVNGIDLYGTEWVYDANLGRYVLCRI